MVGISLKQIHVVVVTSSSEVTLVHFGWILCNAAQSKEVYHNYEYSYFDVRDIVSPREGF